jgi:hypothetical protein
MIKYLLPILVLFITFARPAMSLVPWADKAINLSAAKNLMSEQGTIESDIEVGVFDVSFFGHKYFLDGQFSNQFESPKLNLITPHGTSVSQVMAHKSFGVNENIRFGHFEQGIYIENFKAGIKALKEKGIRLVNISMTLRNKEIVAALNEFIDDGGVVIASAGNSAERLGIPMPAQYEGFKGILVAAMEKDGSLCAFSHYDQGVVMAPGARNAIGVEYFLYDFQGRRPYEPTASDVDNVLFRVRDYGFGMTSAAAPIVSGVVSMALMIKPELTNWQIKDLLNSTASFNQNSRRKLDANAFIKAVYEL